MRDIAKAERISFGDMSSPRDGAAESRRSNRIAAATAASLGGLTIERSDINADIHPDAFHAYNANLGLRSAQLATEETTRIRAYPIEELVTRRISFMALDAQRSGEPAIAGGVYLGLPHHGADNTLGHMAEIHTLNVQERFSGQGGSSRLVGAVATEALMAGYTPYAHAAHPGAKKAFEAYGFEPVAREEVPTSPLNKAAITYLLPPDSESAQLIVSRHLNSTEFADPTQQQQIFDHFFPAESSEQA